MASDGRPEKSEIYSPQSEANKRLRREKAVRCVIDLVEAKQALRDAEESIQPLKTHVAELEEELDGYLK